jgi:hypothetical protein
MDDFREEVFNNLSQRPKEELLEIWLENDRNAWTDTAFDVICEILSEEYDELPSQEEYALEKTRRLNEEKRIAEEKEELRRAEESKSMPVFYNPRQVFWLEKWLYRLALASILLAVVNGFFQVSSTQKFVLSFFPHPDGGWVVLSWVLGIIFTAISVGISSFLLYAVYNALATILRILMEREFTSRKADKKYVELLSPESDQRKSLFLRRTFPSERFPF